MTATVDRAAYETVAVAAVNAARDKLFTLSLEPDAEVLRDIEKHLGDGLTGMRAPDVAVRALEAAAADIHPTDTAARAAYRAAATVVAEAEGLQPAPSVPAVMWLMGNPADGEGLLHAAVTLDTGEVALFVALLAEASLGPPGERSFYDAVPDTKLQEDQGWQLVGGPAEATLRPLDGVWRKPTTAEMCRAAQATGMPGLGFWEAD